MRLATMTAIAGPILRPLGARALCTAARPPPPPPLAATSEGDVEARIYERAFAQYLRKKAAAYAAMNSPPDEAILLKKHKERVVRMWEQLYRMKQLPDLIVCLSHSSDIAREAAAAGIPTISPVGASQPSTDITFAVPISDESPSAKLGMLNMLHDAVRRGADAPRRRRASGSVEHLLEAAGKGSPPEHAAEARRAWAAANDAAAVERAVFARTHSGRSPRGGEYAFPADARRELFRRRAISIAVAAELEQKLKGRARAAASAAATAARKAQDQQAMPTVGPATTPARH
ncbi:hypothetical protein KFE25_011876 [Diacronema lutheri]|uniref:Ribosomal protein S2 n=1 Tax=Diacronema lutheri TaxID=2081491 RepID=A0A8J6C863_DIALT|nr:hypothetical protein KFE25_011876 [Diacronema lutheri]